MHHYKIVIYNASILCLHIIHLLQYLFTCWALLNLCTSSMKRTVRFFLNCNVLWASCTIFFTSWTPEVQAEREEYRHFSEPRQRFEMILASDVCKKVRRQKCNILSYEIKSHKKYIVFFIFLLDERSTKQKIKLVSNVLWYKPYPRLPDLWW